MRAISEQDYHRRVEQRYRAMSSKTPQPLKSSKYGQQTQKSFEPTYFKLVSPQEKKDLKSNVARYLKRLEEYQKQ